MENNETVSLGVVVEWRRVNHPWKDHDWRPVAVFAGAPALDPGGPWKLLREGEGWRQYHAGTLPLELFRSDTPGYMMNLAQQPPRVFVVLRRAAEPEAEHEMLPYLVTVDAYATEHYTDSGEEVVEGVAMPPEILTLLADFCERHHVEEVFVKRPRKNAKGPKDSDDKFSRRPPVERPTGGRGGSFGGGR